MQTTPDGDGALTPEDERVIESIIKATAPNASWGFGHAASLAKLRAHPARLALFLQGQEDEIAPVNLEVWPSLSCNARCGACPYVRNKARRKADQANGAPFLMSLEDFRRLADGFRQAGGHSVNFTGGGEPTLHPALFEFGKIARDLGLDWGLFSNGYALEPATADALLRHAPAWVRVSVNSWSPESHNRTYRLGLDAYETVKRNLVHLAAHAPQETTVGIGYIFPATRAPELRVQAAGIASFVKSVRQSGRLDYVAIRPSVIYYEDGDPLSTQPLADQFRHIPDVCREVLGETCAALGVTLHVNDDGFMALADRTPPSGCLASPWATSATETGRLYLLSEANGSPHRKLEELCYGQVDANNGFAEAWNGKQRKDLAAEFARGTRLAPALHKLSGIDIALRELRERFGVVSPKIARQVEARLATLEKPKHWTFI